MMKQPTQATSKTRGGNEPETEQASSALQGNLSTTSLATVTARQATACDLLQQPSHHMSSAVHDVPVHVPGGNTHLVALQDLPRVIHRLCGFRVQDYQFEELYAGHGLSPMERFLKEPNSPLMSLLGPLQEDLISAPSGFTFYRPPGEIGSYPVGETQSQPSTKSDFSYEYVRSDSDEQDANGTPDSGSDEEWHHVPNSQRK